MISCVAASVSVCFDCVSYVAFVVGCLCVLLGTMNHRRGGVHQRLSRDGDQVRGNPQLERRAQSKLVKFLLPEWAAGHLSPQLLQTICACALQDVRDTLAGNSCVQELETLASIGGGGKFPNKCHQDCRHCKTATTKRATTKRAITTRAMGANGCKTEPWLAMFFYLWCCG